MEIPVESFLSLNQLFTQLFDSTHNRRLARGFNFKVCCLFRRVTEKNSALIAIKSIFEELLIVFGDNDGKKITETNASSNKGSRQMRNR